MNSAAPAAIGGMGDAVARVAAIQAKLSSIVGTNPGGAAIPVFDLPASTSSATPEPATAARGSVTLSDTAPRSAAPATVAAPADTARATETAEAAEAARATEAARARPPDEGSAERSSGPSATPGPWAAKLSEQGQRWAPAIQAAADDAGIDASLLAALVRHESNFDPSVRSHAGAIGLAQLMPGTADGLGVDPTDPHENLAGGARYLKEQLDRFGTPELALAAYNAGPNRVAQAGGVPRIAETTAYVERVLDTWRSWR